ncbi:MAG: hypothetical protein NVS3B20_23360 [Polyangiales bacterium]
MASKNTIVKKTTTDDEDRPINWSKTRVLGRGIHAKRGIRVPLQTLRAGMGKTQMEIAEASEIQQADISRLENKPTLDDVQLSTLTRYVEALGGRLELVAAFGAHRYVLVAGGQTVEDRDGVR